jgi:site-specific recombinase XerD
VSKYEHTSYALIPVERARRLSHRGLDAAWDEVMELRGVTRHLTPHSMRHAFASELKRRAVPVPVIQALLAKSRSS